MVLDETIHEKNYWTSSKACASLVIVDFYGHKSHSGSFFWGMSIFSGFVKQLALFCNVLFINLTSVRPTQENTHTHTHISSSLLLLLLSASTSCVQLNLCSREVLELPGACWSEFLKKVRIYLLQMISSSLRFKSGSLLY